MSADRDQRIAENARIEPENARIETSNPWIDAKNAWIEHIKSMRADGLMTAITSSAVIAVLEDLRENQVIGTQDVQKILDCKETKALIDPKMGFTETDAKRASKLLSKLDKKLAG